MKPSWGVFCLFVLNCSNVSHSESKTYSGAVVDFLSHIVADALQLHLCDVLHRPHYMGDGLASSEGSATGLHTNLFFKKKLISMLLCLLSESRTV